ncbi:MAG: murein L,D-transpeptidase catalytic domain family protein [Ferruginibacter sp.]|nr:murein L,D-transpeptidase catalytic domain family protein [Ferruginibacter sp.]
MNNLGLRKVYLFFSSVLIFVLHIPFVFGKSKPGERIGASSQKQPPVSVLNALGTPENFADNTLYDSLKLGTIGLGRQVFDYAMRGFNYMKEQGSFTNDDVISIVDFSKPSSQKRLFIIDVKNYKLLFNTYVAHGMQSGKEFAEQFSNVPESNKSSLGFYETLGTYIGGHGYSLRLQGLERGINDNANRRDIVIHGAEYVNEKLITSQGYIGRSWGCPAIPQKLHKPIINKIKDGTCLFIYSPDRKYLTRSKILNRELSPFLAMNN